MTDLQPLLPRKIPPMTAIGDAPVMPDLSSMSSMSGGMPVLPPIVAPNVIGNPRMVANSTDSLVNRMSGDNADLYDRTQRSQLSGLNKPTTTLGKIGHVAANIGNVLGDIFAPSTMALIPGTGLNNQVMENKDRADIGAVSDLQTAEGTRQAEAAKTNAAQLIEITPETAESLGNPSLAGEQVTQGAFQHLLTNAATNTMRVGINENTNDTRSGIAHANNLTKTNISDASNKTKSDISTAGLASKAAIAGANNATKQSIAASKSRGKGSNNGVPLDGSTVVDEIGTGRMAADRLSYILARNPELLNEVAQKYPDFDSSKVGAYVQTYKDFTSSKNGTAGGAMNAGGTALQHLNELKDLNTPMSHVPGTADYNAYMNKADTVSAELARFYGTDTVPGIANIKQTLTATLPYQRAAAISTQAKSMGDKLGSYEQTWKNAAPSAAYEAQMPGISQEAMKARASLDPEYAKHAQQGGANAPKVGDKRNGFTYDGTGWTK